MAIIFSQSKAYRDLDVTEIAKISDDDAWTTFRVARWGNTDQTECPDCKKWDKHYFIKTRKQWTCKECKHRFSVTSSTPLSSHKLPLAKLLLILYFYISSPQGKSANQLHSQINTTLRTAFHNLGKVREVLFETHDTSKMTGVVQVDCGHFCGKPRRANVRKKTDSFVVNNRLKSRKDGIVPDLSTHPESWNIKKFQKRRIVLTISQCDTTDGDSRGSNRTLCFIVKQEKASSIIPLIKAHVDRKALIWSDSGNAFKPIHTELGNIHAAVNHSLEYMTKDGVNNNMAESLFSRIRRAEFGTYNGMRPQYLAFYAAEFAWRHDSRKLSLRQKFDDVLKKTLSREPSKAFTGYFQGHRLGFEYIH